MAIGPDEAREIARRDAERVYRDLSVYEIQVEPAPGGGWSVVFELADPTLDGGGPSYVIAADGTIASKAYYQ